MPGPLGRVVSALPRPGPCARWWRWSPTPVGPAAGAFARAHGGDAVVQHADWRDLLADPSIDAVSVTAPNVDAPGGRRRRRRGRQAPLDREAGGADRCRRLVAVSRRGRRRRGRRGSWASTTATYCGRLGPARLIAGRRHRDADARPGPAPSPTTPPTRAARCRGAMLVARGGHGVLGDLASHGVDLSALPPRRRRGRDRPDGRSTIPKRPGGRGRRGTTASLDVDEPGLTFGEVENEDYVVAISADASRASSACLRGRPGRRR